MPAAFLAGILLLALAWVGPLPDLAGRMFSAHMAMHIVVVAFAAPLLAAGLAGSRWDPVRHWPAPFQPVAISIVELVVVWGWHLPSLHHFARHTPGAVWLEQVTFLAAGLALWLSALGGDSALQAGRRVAGICGLLMTSMHMTLLGVLLALAGYPLYPHAEAHRTPPDWQPDAMLDQQLGGILMLIAGGTSYLAGSLILLGRLLGDRAARPPAGRAYGPYRP